MSNVSPPLAAVGLREAPRKISSGGGEALNVTVPLQHAVFGQNGFLCPATRFCITSEGTDLI